MISKSAWAKAMMAGTAFTLASLSLPVAAVNAQEAPSVALEQARRGEDGVSGAGATSGNLESGSSKRDKDGNGGTASAGGSGEVATGNTSTSTDGASEEASGDAPPPPANADLLSALGILDDVTTYGIDVLSDSDIPLELLPAPTENSSPSAPADVNTGGQGSSGEAISTDPGAGSAPADAGAGSAPADTASEGAPAGGSTASAAEDGTENSGGKKKDKADKAAEGASGTDGGTETSTATG